MAAPAWPVLAAARAAELDARLMRSAGGGGGGGGGFLLAQLMELAGLAVATAVAKQYPVATFPRVLVVCGSGNNGGDGLVAARHLKHFAFDPTVVLPRPRRLRGDADDALFAGLVTQLTDLGIPVVADMPLPPEPSATSLVSTDGGSDALAGPAAASRRDWHVVVDAVFGFSGSGPPRAPFDEVIAKLVAWQRAGRPIVSVDMPSGWNVDGGDDHGTGLLPECLVSLTGGCAGVAGEGLSWAG
jgi:NAD(P)H-hydrate repair Nnr-like enzyme with NAD(P)H-hydrate epimerase domain